MTPDIQQALSVLCPMHVQIAADGRITGVGATLAKTMGRRDLIGQMFFHQFQVSHPVDANSLDGLIAHAGRRLQLKALNLSDRAMKAVAVTDGAGGVIVDLSFGLMVVQAVRDHGLSGTDFSPTDLAVEMLYLVEAQSAAFRESRGLNDRLHGQKIAAEEQAYTDTLTGLKNRRAMDLILAKYLSAGGQFALLHLDLDYFKNVNDTLGHAAGDHVLQVVAQVLLKETRQNDTIARVGGDEFVLLFDGLVNRDRLTKIAKRLINRLEVPIAFDDKECRISASLGITCSSDYTNPTAERLMSDADIALYASKRAGRAQHHFFDRSLATSAPAAAGRA